MELSCSELLKKIKEETETLVLVLFFEEWNKFSLKAKEEIISIESKVIKKFYCSDSEHFEKDFDIQSTPSVMFYWKGISVEIERVNFDLDNKSKFGVFQDNFDVVVGNITGKLIEGLIPRLKEIVDEDKELSLFLD